VNNQENTSILLCKKMDLQKSDLGITYISAEFSKKFEGLERQKYTDEEWAKHIAARKYFAILKKRSDCYYRVMV